LQELSNQMKILTGRYYFKLLLFFLVAIGNFSLQAQKPSKGCPRNFDGKKLISVQKEIKKHEGEIVAFDAEVTKIEIGFNDKPYFEVRLDNGTKLWIASMMANQTLAVKRKARILGYLNQVKSDDEIGRKFNKNGIQVLAFAILDIETKQLNYSDAFDEEAKLWKNGRVPPQ